MKSGTSRWVSVLIVVVSSAAAQTPGLVWESVFDQPLTSSPQMFYSAPPDSPAPYSIQLTASPNGDYYLHVPDWTGRATISRLSRNDDSVVWRRIVSGDRMRLSGRLAGRATADGGALAIGGGVARFSADGQFLWSRAADTAYQDTPTAVHVLNDDDLLLLSASPPGSHGARLSRVDAMTGALIDGTAVSSPSASCSTGLLGTDTVSDAAYLVTSCLISGQVIETLSKRASDHSVVWTRVLPEGTNVIQGDEKSLVDVQALYIGLQERSGRRSIVRLLASDGFQHWTRPDVSGDLRFDATGRILVSRSSGASHHIELLSPGDGASVWAYEMAARGVHLDAAVDGVYLAGTDEERTHGIVVRLNEETGAPIWHRLLTAPLTGGHFQPGAVLANLPAIRIAGANCRPETECRVGVVRIDRTTGAASPISYPTVPQTALGNSVADGNTHVLAYALEPVQVSMLVPIDLGQQLRVRRIDLTGAIEWERVFPIPTLERLDVARVSRTGDGDLLVVVNTPRVSAPTYGYASIAKYSGTDGQLRWEKRLLSESGPGMVDFTVDSDPSGNIFLGASSAIYGGAGVGYIRTRSLSLLDAGSGAVRWSQTLMASDSPGLAGSAPPFHVVENDVVMLESPSSMSPGAIVRLSGASGAVVWASTELVTPGAGLIAADADDGFMRDTGNGVKAFSMASGEVRWTYRYADPVAAGGAVLSGAVGDDGDLYVGGSRAGGSGWTARVARDSGVLLWVDHFDGPVGAVHARVTVRDAAQGRVHVTQRRGAELFLTRLDQGTGAFVDSSLLSRSPIDDEAVADDGALYQRRMPDGQILAPGTAYRPGEALRPWVGRLAAPSAGIRGNLALSLAVSPAVASPGVVRTLTLPISYTGESAVSDALALVDLDTAVAGRNDAFIVDALDCTTTGGGSCSAVSTPTGIRLHLDLLPGSVATLTAQLRAIDQAGVVSAKVHAPYGLLESDMLDNEASVGVSADRLFVDDFD